MIEVLRFRVEKLIRDKMPEIMRAAGLRVFERTMDFDEFVRSLRTKLVEEAAEAAASASPEDLLGELADVMEVVIALTEASDFTFADLEAARLAKREARGGFAGRIHNAAIEADEGCPALSYYLSSPDKYPRL